MQRFSTVCRRFCRFSLLTENKGLKNFQTRQTSHSTVTPTSVPRSWNNTARRYMQTDLRMPPSTNGTITKKSSAETFGNFDLVKRIQLPYIDVVVSKWRSRVTGLSVVHLDYEAPLVNGYFVIGTEIFDDSGCPHTLEHLVFMGSEKYPYKGIIDHFANRGFSNGTNAWTDNDHTAYTASTAGEQGFLQLLPIYVDHILYPTITDPAFVTEVHHINAEGEDSGVVYSEMQGRENTSGDLMALSSQRLLYPPGSAYRSETGGLMEALRTLTAEQIRQYHSTYYVPHNLSLIVTGKLSSGTESLLSVVQEQVESNIIAHGFNKGPRPPNWKRPFVETPSALREPLKAIRKETVAFPEKDESMGELIMTFLGPSPNQFLERSALDVLGTYLTSSSVAPLNKEYVEIESPLCSYIYFSEDVRASCVDLPIYVGSVPTEHLDDFDEKLRASFQRIAEEGIDMERMSMVISREERQLRSKLEASKGDAFSGTVIYDFLYGAEDASELGPSMDELAHLKNMQGWSSKQWTDLLQKYFIDSQYIVVRGKPSANLAEKLEKDEKARLEAQRQKLGADGLAEMKERLENAKKEHDKPIPHDVLTKFPVPDVGSISWIPVQSYQEKGISRFKHASSQTELARHVQSDGSPVPMFIQYDHVKSDFVSIHAFFSLAKLPNRLRPYISTYLSAFFSLPVVRANGECLTHEQVVNQLDNETVSYEAALGISERFAETLRVSFKVEPARYESTVAWLRDLVFSGVFDKERLQVTVAKLQQSIPELKRDGNNVLSSVWSEKLFDESSTSRAGAVLSQAEFIPKLATQLQNNPESVIADFEELRSYLVDPSGVRISVTGNVIGISNPRSAWAKHFKESLPESALDAVPLSSATLSELGRNPVRKATVVNLPTIESSYVNHTTRAIQGFNHPDVAALGVALEVLNATESYLWRSIRGSGLAYGAYMTLDKESGLLSFSLYRSSNSLQAFEEASKVVHGLVDRSIELEDTTLDAAKSSIVYSVTKGVSTAGRAAITSFTNQALKGVSQDQHLELLKKYQSVTADDVLSALQKYVLPVFNSTSSTAVVVTSPSKVDQIAEGLASYGFEVEKRTLEVEPDDDGSDESGTYSGSGSDDSISER